MSKKWVLIWLFAALGALLLRRLSPEITPGVVRGVTYLIFMVGFWMSYLCLFRWAQEGEGLPFSLVLVVWFGVPAAGGLAAGLLSHSWMVGLVYGLPPVVIPLCWIGGYVIPWGLEKLSSIRDKRR